MFNLFNRKANTNSQKASTWVVGQLEDKGKIYLLRFNSALHEFKESSTYTYQIGIATKLNTNNNGFPTGEENAELSIIEEMIINLLCNKNLAVFAGVITGGGIKEFVLYTPYPVEIETQFNQFKAEVKNHTLQINIQSDPEWKVYKTYCPTKPEFK
jgi:hypothetical protein